MTLALPATVFLPMIIGCVVLLGLIAWASLAPLERPREPRAPRHAARPEPWQPLGLVTDGTRAVPDSRDCTKGRCRHRAHSPRVSGGRS